MNVYLKTLSYIYLFPMPYTSNLNHKLFRLSIFDLEDFELEPNKFQIS